MSYTKIKVEPISKRFFDNLKKLKNWNETKLKKGLAIQKHSHQFNAMYFTKNVRTLVTKTGSMLLPPYAAVFIPKRTEHGWSDVTYSETAVVGHFHSGHGIHKRVPAI